MAIVIDNADLYQLTTTGAQTNAIVASPYSVQSLTGSVVVSSGTVTVTGQKGQFLSNLGIGTLATMNYSVIG